MSTDIRSLRTYAEFKACERLQADVLGFGDLETVPYQLLYSFATSGGIVLGAFDGTTLIGCVMGYTGLQADGTPYHRSQRMAVLPAYRGKGIGEALKRRQAEQARAYGLCLMCWTFDPLRSLNAHLNMHKLGGRSRRYIENAYEASTSPRDAGMRIDRLWVEWLLAPSRSPDANVGQTPDHEWKPQIIPIVLANEADAPGLPDLSCTEPVVLVQIPQEIDAVRARDIALARSWRDITCYVFQTYFIHGYQVMDYYRERGYVLARVNG